jgi:hypothetical protein
MNWEMPYGFLFRMGVNEKIIRDIVRTFADELRAEGLDDAAIFRRAKARDAEAQRRGGAQLSGSQKCECASLK